MRTGDLILGLRSNSETMTDQLARLLASHLVDDPPPPNVSVVLADHAPDARGNKHHLLRGCHPLLATRSVGRLVRAVPHILSGYVEPGPEFTQMNVRAFVGPDDAVLVDSRFDGALRAAEPSLAAQGYLLASDPQAYVQRRTLEHHSPPPVVMFDSPELTSFGNLHPTTPREWIRGEPVPIRSLLAHSDQASNDRPGARRVAQLAHLVSRRTGRVVPRDMSLVGDLDAKGLVNTFATLTRDELLATAAAS